MDTINVNLKEQVVSIRKTSDEVKKWQEIKRNLYKPSLQDVSLISDIYQMVENECHVNSNIDTFKYDVKHYFLFCVMMLYSPRVLADENMNEGIRDVVAEVLNISPEHVSNSCAKVRDWFFIYRDFENSLVYLYSEIRSRLDEHE